MKMKRALCLFAFAFFCFGCASSNNLNAEEPKLYSEDAKMYFDFDRYGYDEESENTWKIEGEGDVSISIDQNYCFVLSNGEEEAETLSLGYVRALYSADINRDGYPELCMGFSVGSGWINEMALVYDYHSKETLLCLDDRWSHDYFFGIDGEGILCVYEFPVMRREPLLRSGRVYYGNDGKVDVEWTVHAVLESDSTSL